MAFGDTITITINSVAKVLNKINQDGYTSEYLLRETTGEFSLKIRNSRDKTLVNGFPQERHYVTFSHTVYAVAGVSPSYFRQISATLLYDKTDVKATHLLEDVGFVAWLTSSNMGKLIDWEL
jgi:hypothetical protein